MSRMDDLNGRLKAVLVEAQKIAAKADDEKRDFTDEERGIVTAKMKEAEDIGNQIKQAKGDAKLRQTLAGLGDDIDVNDHGGTKRAPNGNHMVPQGKSLGEHFVSTDEYKELLAGAPGGQFTKQHRVQTRPVGYEQLLPSRRGRKDLITGGGSTSAGSLVWPDFLGLQVGLYAFERPLMLRDLVTAGETTSDTIEYVRVTGTTNSAAPVAEATDLSTGIKPESGMTTQRVTTNVRTVAHWIPVTKRALSDAAQIRTLIDNFLAYGLEEALETQMISGDGTGENLDGILNTSGVQSQAFDTNVLTTLRKAKTKVRTVGRSIPTGYILNPTDVEALDLLTDGIDRFYFGGPSGTLNNGGLAGPTTKPLWDLPVIETEAVPVGTAVVGDWRKAILWDRQQSAITMSDSHASFFIQNLVAVLAELRAAFGIIQPSAFVQVELTAGP